MQLSNSIIEAKCDYILGLERGLFTKIAIRNPRHYSSDHYMIMGTIYYRPNRENKSYSRSRKSFPLKRNKVAPINKADSIFYEIEYFMVKDSCTWKLVESKVTLRKIVKGIKADRKERTQKSGKRIEILLKARNMKGVWRSLQAWYGKGSKPSRSNLESAAADFKALYMQNTDG
jgi:hypothetical protein